MGVHAVLHVEHVHALPAELQPLEETLLVVMLLRWLREDRGGQLAGVAHEDEAAARVLERDEGRDLDGLGG